MKQKLLLTLLITTIFSVAKAQVPSYVPTNGLLGWWNFNGNVNDLSGLGNNGTPINSPTYTNDRFGNPNACIQLNGINQRVDLPLNLNGALVNLKKLSISSFVKIDTTAGYYGIFSNWKAFPLTDPFGFEVITDDAKFRGSTNGGTGVYADSSNYKGVWNHVVVTFDGSLNGTKSKMKIFINGVLHSTDTMPNVYSNCVSDSLGNTATNTAFGAWFSQFGWIGYLKGNLDDIGIWNRALTPQEIATIYASSSSGISSNIGLNTIKLYPNPTNTATTITLTKAVDNATIKLINLTGQTIIEKQNQTGDHFNLDISQQTQGIYFVEIRQADNVWRTKVVKQ